MEDVTVTQARQENFVLLFRQFREKHAERPDRGMLKAFAEEIGMSDRYLSHVKCGRKAIGHAVARQMEEALKLPEGWMDRRHAEIEPTGSDERLFMETMIALFRAAPGDARRLMLEAVKDRLGQVGKK